MSAEAPTPASVEAAEWQRKYGALESEFREFQESSKEYERELEGEVSSAAAERTRIKQASEKLAQQLDEARRKAEAAESQRATEVGLSRHPIPRLPDLPRCSQPPLSLVPYLRLPSPLADTIAAGAAGGAAGLRGGGTRSRSQA